MLPMLLDLLDASVIKFIITEALVMKIAAVFTTLLLALEDTFEADVVNFLEKRAVLDRLFV